MSSSRKHRARRRPAPGKPARHSFASGDEFEVVIEALGSAGDGLARHDGRRLIIPGAVPGERHRVRLLNETRGTINASSVACSAHRTRAAPPCPHFNVCGGCVTQHLPEPIETEWKIGLVRRALARRGLDAAVALAHRSPLASRRRLRLAIAYEGGGARVGYRARGSHDVVEVVACPIALPALEGMIGLLPELLNELETRPVEAELSGYAAGLEIVLRAPTMATLADRESLAAWSTAHDLARAAWHTGGAAEPVAARRPPLLAWPALTVAPPPGAFLQATEAGEQFLQGAVTQALQPGDRVLDLYAGVGTLSAAAKAAGASVAAVENNTDAVTALTVAGVPATRRDLDRRPMQGGELRDVDVVVVDPPRRGAESQVRALAASEVARVIYVSCSPATFARDAAILVAAGLEFDHVDVVDQFRFSAEVELIACFERKKGA